MASFLDACEFQDYINEAGWWATQRVPLVSKTGNDVASVADIVQADPEAHEGHIEVSQAQGLTYFNKCFKYSWDPYCPYLSQKEVS